eukprot:scaffold80403_cov35-Prasinocladus_malaysianus.AAC.2
MPMRSICKMPFNSPLEQLESQVFSRLNVRRLHVSRVAIGDEKPEEVQHVVFAPPPPPLPPGCEDKHKMCKSWAMQG